MRPAITALPQLRKYLTKIEALFDIPGLIDQEIDHENIVDYYLKSRLGYSVFHSSLGSIHMALNFDGEFDKSGYYGQAQIVLEQIKALQARHILEIGSGQGFNSLYLAKAASDVEFTGLDLTPEHVKRARKSGGSMQNLRFLIGDFQDLPFGDEDFDLAFEVESVCHATEMRKALNEAYRVLKPGGRYVLFDGFRENDFDDHPADLRLAVRLVEVAMAIGYPHRIGDWLEIARETGFEVQQAEDISEAEMPNLARFQFMARGFFKYPSLGKALKRILGFRLVANAIAGLLMPFTIGNRCQAYYQINLSKP